MIALALLRAVPFRAWLYIGLIVAALGGFLFLRQHFINQGAADATAKIERANDANVSKANQAEQDARRCFALGGQRDASTGLCVAAGK
ncbi:hypothetical protein [Labrys neptuniae]